MSRLALIAGQGRLPALLAAHLAAGGADFAVHALQGFAPDGLAARPFRLEHLGSLIAGLVADGVGRVCFCGAVRRPGFDPARLDAATAPLVPGLLAAVRRGDDGLLRAVAALFENAGLRVVGAHELMPALVAPPPGSAPPALAADAARGRAVLAALGALDVGQACVVAEGQVLGIETIQGTEALLRFVAETRPESGGVLVKRAKPGQDLRLDMPAIGPDTVRQVRAAGLAGICVETGRVLLLDRASLLEEAAAAGIALWAAP